MLTPLVEGLHKAGAKVYFVGGLPRDLLLGIVPNDIDLEVFGLEEGELEKILEEFGTVQKVGKSFGVWKFRAYNELYTEDEIDIAMPRREVKAGRKHAEFEVQVDPYMEPKEAASRRDFTINAFMMEAGGDNPEFLDFFGGRANLNNCILRHVSDDHFAEDPLRPLRAMQLAGRYALTMDKDTAKLCKSMFEKGMHKDLPVERVWGEFKKWALSDMPFFGLKALVDMGWVKMFPELYALAGLTQDATWHPEGNVLQHTAHVVDEISIMAAYAGIVEEDRLVLVLAALCHDFGKATTTTMDEDGRIRSREHAKAGRKPTRSFLERIGAPKNVIERVVPLVGEHMVQWKIEPTDRAIRRLARRLAPATIRELHLLIRADFLGRPPLKPKDPFKELAEIAERLELMDSQPKEILMGRHLIEKGVEPGVEMGKILREAFDAQLDGEFSDLEGAIQWFEAKG